MLEPEFALAVLMHHLRQDWNITSCREQVLKALEHKTLAETAMAAIRLTQDMSTRAPSRLLQNGPWWREVAPAQQPKPVSQPKQWSRGPINSASPATVARYTDWIRQQWATREGDDSRDCPE